MKKLLTLGALLSLACLSTAVHANPFAQIGEARKGLVQAQLQVKQAVEQLKTTYKEINDNVVEKTAKIKDKELGPQAKTMEKTIGDIKAVPGFARSTLCFGDLVPTLNFIKDNLLKTLLNMVTTIHGGFASANAMLDPKTDPKEVYKNLKLADEKFASAIKKLDNVMLAFMAF